MHINDIANTLKAGQWAVLNQPNDGSNYGTNLTSSGSGGPGGALKNASKATYDPIRHRVFFLGAGYNGNPPVMFICGELELNKWSILPVPSWWPQPAGNGSSYALQTISNNKFIRFHANTWKGYSCDIDRDNPQDIIASSPPYPWLTSNPPSSAIFRAFVEAFPDRNTELCFDSGYSYQLWERRVDGPWAVVKVISGLSGDGIKASYNPVHKAVVFGGGQSTKKFYKYDLSGQLTQLDECPVSTISGVFTVDPVSGKHLWIGPNATYSPTTYWFYELDLTKPFGSRWTRRTDLEPLIPQLGVVTNTLQASVCTPIPDAGVVLFLCASKVYIYRHTATAIPPPPDLTPPTITMLIQGSSKDPIVWDTNEPTTGMVEYGPTPSYGQIAHSRDLKTKHSVVMPNLVSGQTYHCRITATDAAGNSTVFGDFHFKADS